MDMGALLKMVVDATKTQQETIMGILTNAPAPKKDDDDWRLVSIKEAAKYLHVHEKTIWYFAKKGRLHVVPIGEKARRIRLSELRELAENGIPAEELKRPVQLKNILNAETGRADA